MQAITVVGLDIAKQQLRLCQLIPETRDIILRLTDRAFRWPSQSQTGQVCRLRRPQSCSAADAR